MKKILLSTLVVVAIGSIHSLDAQTSNWTYIFDSPLGVVIPAKPVPSIQDDGSTILTVRMTNSTAIYYNYIFLSKLGKMITNHYTPAIDKSLAQQETLLHYSKTNLITRRYLGTNTIPDTINNYRISANGLSNKITYLPIGSSVVNGSLGSSLNGTNGFFLIDKTNYSTNNQPYTEVTIKRFSY